MCAGNSPLFCITSHVFAWAYGTLARGEIVGEFRDLVRDVTHDVSGERHLPHVASGRSAGRTKAVTRRVVSLRIRPNRPSRCVSRVRFRLFQSLSKRPPSPARISRASFFVTVPTSRPLRHGCLNQFLNGRRTVTAGSLTHAKFPARKARILVDRLLTDCGDERYLP
jgi:hypothetical protein